MANIIGGRIEYERVKTHKPYSIAINENIKSILDYYIESKSRNDYIFPIIKRHSIEGQRKDIKNELKNFNKRMRKIAILADVNQHLTSYVARHSWASIANFSGLPLGIISQGLGHDDMKTTQDYLKDFEYKAIDDANQNIL